MWTIEVKPGKSSTTMLLNTNGALINSLGISLVRSLRTMRPKFGQVTCRDMNVKLERTALLECVGTMSAPAFGKTSNAPSTSYTKIMNVTSS